MDEASVRRIDVIAILAIVVGIALRLAQLWGDQRLWLDELFSVAVAESPLRDVILATLRYDTHPPLYYIQLHIWSWFGQSDLWFILNSVILSLVSIALMGMVVRRHHGTRAALWAAAFMAVLPLGVFFAENVRMYAWVAVLQILLWSVIEDGVRDGFRNRRRLVLIAILAVAVTMSHGLGFYLVFFLMAYAAQACFIGPGRRREIRLLVIAYLPAAMLSGWTLVIGSFRRTEGMEAFTFSGASRELALTLLGLEFPFPEVAGVVALAGVALLGLSVRAARPVMFWLVLLPWAILLVISLVIKPVFMYRTMGLFLPFVAMGLGLAIAQLHTTMRNHILAVAIVALCVASGVNYTLRFEKDGFRAIVAAIDEAAGPQALIVAPRNIDVWAITRYMPPAVGARSALDLQPTVRGGMARMEARLEGSVLERWGFLGRVDHIRLGDRRLVTGTTPEALQDQNEVWLLNEPAGCAGLEAERGFHEAAAISLQGSHATLCLPVEG